MRFCIVEKIYDGTKIEICSSSGFENWIVLFVFDHII